MTPKERARIEKFQCQWSCFRKFLLEEIDAAQAEISTMRPVVEAARRYRAEETDGTPRMWRGKKLQDLANDLDEKLAAFDGGSDAG